MTKLIKEKMFFPDNIYIDIDHLCALGLTEYHFQNRGQDIQKMKEHGFYPEFGTYKLLPWGKRFIEACSVQPS